MIDRLRRSAMVLVAVLVTAAPLYAGGERERDLSRSADQATTITAADIIPEDLSYSHAPAVLVAPHGEADRVLVGSLIAVARDATADVPRRALSQSERRALIGRRVAAEIERRAIERAREAEQLERSALAGVNGTAREASSAGVSDDSGVRVDIERVPDEVPLEPAELDYRLRRVLHDPEPIAAEFDLDLMFILRLDRLDDLLVLLTVELYNRSFDRTEQVMQLVAEDTEVATALSARSSELVNSLAARPLGAVDARAVNAAGEVLRDAAIAVNGELVGFGSARRRFAPAGGYRVVATMPDGREAVGELLLGAGQTAAVDLLVPPVEESLVLLSTDPPGSGVYRGAVWVGTTPISVPRPRDALSYTFVSEGYYDGRVTVTPASPDEISRTMLSREVDWQANVTRARNRFYRAFGAFAVSVGAPVMLNGLYANLGGLYPNGVADAALSVEEQLRLQQQANMLFYGYYASLGVSGTLLGATIWRLVQYIGEAQGFHTR